MMKKIKDTNVFPLLKLHKIDPTLNKIYTKEYIESMRCNKSIKAIIYTVFWMNLLISFVQRSELLANYQLSKQKKGKRFNEFISKVFFFY